MDQRIDSLIEFMHKNLGRSISIAEMSEVVNLSPSRLRSLFRASTGISLGRYLKSLRMQKARELAETSFLSIKQIAAAVGCNDISHFVRDFKRSFGSTPAHHRQSSGAQPLPPRRERGATPVKKPGHGTAARQLGGP